MTDKRGTKKMAITVFIVMIIMLVFSVFVIRSTVKFPRYIVNIETEDGKKVSVSIGDHEGTKQQAGLKITYFKVSNIFNYNRAIKNGR